MRAAKLTVMLIAAAALCASAVCLSRRTAFECGDGYTFYTGSASSSCRVVTAGSNPRLTLLTLSDVRGETTSYPSLDIEKFLERTGGEILFEERLSDSVNYYCSADLPYSVQLYGKTVNLHICVRDDGVTVGSPVIFGGY